MSNVVNFNDANTRPQPFSMQQDVAQANVPMHVPAVLVGAVAQPVGPAQPLPVYNPGNPVVGEGGTIASGSQAQLVFSGATAVNGYIISNLHVSETLYANDLGVATLGSGLSIPILPGKSFQTPAGYKPPGPVSVVAATSGHAYSARRW
jgi:hypothetical protein